jgi:FkbM family methyltransferase
MSYIKENFIFAVKRFFEFFGVAVISKSRLINLYSQLAESNKSRIDLEFIKTQSSSNLVHITNLLQISKSQLRQDLFVLSELEFKKDGFFVEFGATNGVDLSNTYVLEKNFEWKGILAEPAKVWNKNLIINRPGSFIENRCVWKDSNSILLFNETQEPELSTIDIYSQNDMHGKERKFGDLYEVRTISLTDLLKKFNAPKYIDYISIDTEGSEFEILNAFDFNEYSFRVITCEHNFTPTREKVYDLLIKNGYERKFEKISGFDDWYVQKSY